MGVGGLVSAPRSETGAREEAASRAELDALRESFHAELARKAARIAELEQLVHETGNNYRATLSWRITAPLRAASRIARALRRSSRPRG
jgi:hypothetical protein